MEHKAKERAKRAEDNVLGLTRRHKNAIHVACLLAICLSLITEGGGMADWSFLALALICEVA